MPYDRLEVSRFIPATPEAIYDAFLDGAKHSAMTGSPATASSHVGGRFTAWDGYIEGENVSLVRPNRIVQTWRASDFPPGAASSRLDIHLEVEGEGTRILLVQEDLPDGTAARFTEGWEQFYFEPMRAYFLDRAEDHEDVRDLVGEEVSLEDSERAEALREAARAEDEDDAAEAEERSEVDGAIRSLWEATALGDVRPASADLRAPAPIVHVVEEDEDDDEELRTPTLRAPPRRPAAAQASPDEEDQDDDDQDDDAVTLFPAPLAPQPTGFGAKAAPKKAAPKKAAKKAAPKKAAKKAAPKKAAPKKAAPKKAAPKKAAPKKAAKKAAKKKKSGRR